MANFLFAIGIIFIIGAAYEFIAENTDYVPFSIQEDLIKTWLPVRWVMLAIGVGLCVLGL